MVTALEDREKRNALDTLTRHWSEYLMEAAGLGLFMLSAVVVATVIEHPSSPVRAAIDNPLLRRIPMGLAMGLTAIGIIYSPWGKRSGAHINPAVTLTFYRLGKMARWDAILYVLAQCVGGVGVWDCPHCLSETTWRTLP